MISVYSKPRCSACENTKKGLARRGLKFEEISLTQAPEILEEAKERGILSAPIVVANGIMWGGHNEAKLDELINSDADWDF